MAKVFLSYPFTGEDFNELGEVLTPIVSIVKEKGHAIFCSYFEEDNFKERGLSPEQIYAECVRIQRGYDTFMALIKSERPSSGMKAELEKAIDLKQKNVLLIRRDLTHLFPEFVKTADLIISYSTYLELNSRLRTLGLN